MLPVSIPAVPQPQRRAVAEIDAHIARAELAHARYLQDLEALPGVRRTRVLLRQAEERLAHLRQSREVLLAGDEGR